MMSNINNIIAPLLLLAFLVLYAGNSINAQEVLDERDFDYAENSLRGPLRWGQIRPEWAACNNGTTQSPVDMSNERVRIISTPESRNYTFANATVRNRGHDIQIAWHGDAGSAVINGTVYNLHFAHWHSPSEHTVNGRRYDMELHLVHQNPNPNARNKFAVIGIFYTIGAPDPFLSKLMRNITLMMNMAGQERSVGMVNPNGVGALSRSYYRYMGSLTVPPCTEGVLWTLDKQVRTVSRRQVGLLREAVNDNAALNARPVQPRNQRNVYLYGPGGYGFNN